MASPRSGAWWLLRLELIGYVLVGAIGLLALAFLVVLGPLVFRAARPMRAGSRRSKATTYRPVRRRAFVLDARC